MALFQYSRLQVSGDSSIPDVNGVNLFRIGTAANNLFVADAVNKVIRLPSADMTISGDLSIGGSLDVLDLKVRGNETVVGTFSVSGGTSLYSSLFVTGNTRLDGTNVDISGLNINKSTPGQMSMVLSGSGYTTASLFNDSQTQVIQIGSSMNLQEVRVGYGHNGQSIIRIGDVDDIIYLGGTTVTVMSTDVYVNDKKMYLNFSTTGTTMADAADSGIYIGEGTNSEAAFIRVGPDTSHSWQIQGADGGGIVTLNTQLSGEVITTDRVGGLQTIRTALNVTGAATLSNTLGVSGAATFSNDVSVLGNETVSGTLRVSGSTTLNSSLHVSTQATLGSLMVNTSGTIAQDLSVLGNETVSGTLNVSGAATLQNNLSVLGSETVTGTMVVGGNGTFSSDLRVVGNETINGSLYATGNSFIGGNLAVGYATATKTLDVNGAVRFGSTALVGGGGGGGGAGVTDGSILWSSYIDGIGIEMMKYVSTDSSNNVYSISIADSSTVTLYNTNGTSYGTVSKPMGASNYCVITKQDSSGAYQWKTTIHDDGNNNISNARIAVGGSGNVYVSGHRDGTMGTLYVKNADGTTFGTYYSPSRYLWVIKYNSSGVAQWFASADVDSFTDSNGLAVDSSENVYITSVGDMSVTFYNWSMIMGGNIMTYSYGSISSPSKTGYLAKINSSGVFQWVSKISGFNSGFYVPSVYATSSFVVVGAQISNNYISLYDSSNTLQIQTTSTSSSGFFLIRYSTAGSPTWSVRIDGASTDEIRSHPKNIAVDSSNNIYICGRSNITDIFSPMLPGDLSDTLSSSIMNPFPSDGMGIIIKFNSSGVYQQRNIMGGNDGTSKFISSIATDSNDNLIATFVSNSTTPTIYSSDGLTTKTISSNGTKYVTGIVKITSAGALTWIASIIPDDGSGVAGAFNTVVDSGDNIYVSGDGSGYASPIKFYDVNNTATTLYSTSSSVSTILVKISGGGGGGGGGGTAVASLVYGSLVMSSSVTDAGSFTLYVDGSANVTGDFKIGANSTVDGTMFVSGATTLNSSLRVNGNTTLGGDLYISGALSLDNLEVRVNQTVGGTLRVSGATTLNNTLGVDGSATFSNDVSVLGSETVSGTLRVSGATTLNSSLQVSTHATLGSLMVNTSGTIAQDLSVLGNETVSGTLRVSGAATLNNTLGVSGAATFSNDVSVLGNETVSGTLNVSGDATLDSNLEVVGNAVIGFNLKVGSTNPSFTSIVDMHNVDFRVTGTTTFIGETTVTSTLGVSGAATFSNDVSVLGSETVSGTLLVSGAATLDNTLGVSGAATFSNDVSVLGSETVSGTLLVSGAATLDNTLGVSGAATFSNDVSVLGSETVSGTLLVSGAATLDNTLGVSGAATFSNDVSVLGSETVSGTLRVSGAATLNSSLQVSTHATLGSLMVNTSGTIAQDLSVLGNETVSGTLRVSSSATLNSTLGVDGSATFSNDVSVIGNETVSGTIRVSGAATLDNTLGVSGAATFSNDVSVLGSETVSGTLRVSGNGTFSSDLRVVGNETINGSLYATGNSFIGGDLAIGYATATKTLDVNGAMRFGTTTDNSGTVGSFLWASRVDGAADDLASGITTDLNNNVYSAYHFNSNPVTIYDSAGSAVSTETSSGVEVLLVKQNSTGGYLWKAKISSTATDAEPRVVCGNSGNVYVSGWSDAAGTMTIRNSDGTTFGTYSVPSWIQWVVKYNSSGFAQWLAAVSNEAYEVGISVDPNENIYIVSQQYATGVDSSVFYNFGSVSGGTINLTSSITLSGNTTIGYLAKLNSSGAFQWAAKIIGSSSTTGIWSVSASATDVAIGMYSNAALSLYDGSTPSVAGNLAVTSSAPTDRGCFLGKYSSAGVAAWIARIDSSGGEYPSVSSGVNIDRSNNIYMVGSTPGTLVAYTARVRGVETESTAKTYSVATQSAGFVAKYDTNGGFLWGTLIDGAGNDDNSSVVTDWNNNVYIGYRFTGATVTIYNANGGTNITKSNDGSRATGVARFDRNGNLEWATVINGGGTDMIYDLNVDSAGDILAIGRCSGTVNIRDKDNTIGTTFSPTGWAGFVVKYKGTTKPESSFGYGSLVLSSVLADTPLDGYTLYVDGSANITGGLYIGGNGTYDGGLTISGASTMKSNLSVLGNETVSGTLRVSGASTFNNTLGVSGAATFSNDLAVLGSETISGTLSVSGASTFQNNMTVLGAMTITGSANIYNEFTFTNNTTNGLYLNMNPSGTGDNKTQGAIFSINNNNTALGAGNDARFLLASNSTHTFINKYFMKIFINGETVYIPCLSNIGS